MRVYSCTIIPRICHNYIMKTIYNWIYSAICGLYAIEMIVIETVHHVIMDVAQDHTGTNILLNFLQYVNFILFLFIFVLFDMYVLLWL